ncbi:MAG: TetR/AcrR family transcriptional regulator [Caldilineaceae bacterium]|nr:TetR/AcrR family transcriptional regulator [Caldilineaceae bacterium]
MPRQRQVALNEATSNAIKDTARQLMAEKGTAGLSLRAIARELEMTAPALYHYFPSLDDLITALIVDAFRGHAAYVRQQRDAAIAAGKGYREQLFVAMQAYRQWALDQPIDFQLVYGNPIPGYAAPAEVTTPAARSLGEVFMETLLAAVQAGEIDPPTFTEPIPPTVLNHYRHHFGLDGPQAQIFHQMNHGWSLMHGMVTLEIYNHAAPVVGDTDAFYEQAIRHQFHLLGIDLP